MIFSRRALALGTCCGLLAFAGCRQPSATDVVRDRVQKAVEKNKDALQDFGTLVTKNSTLTGNDAQGRPLWSLQFKLGKISNGSDAASGDGASGETRRGDLQNAHATLYSEGKPETTFSAKKNQVLRFAARSGDDAQRRRAGDNANQRDLKRHFKCEAERKVRREAEREIEYSKRDVACPNVAGSNENPTTAN